MCVRSFFSQRWTRIFLLLLVISAISAAAFAQGTGYWHTSGNQIIDSSGRMVRIAGINWYGFETKDQVVHGLWARDYHTILNAIKNTGYNAIRLPYSNQMVESPIIPSNISYSNGSGAINTVRKLATAPKPTVFGIRVRIRNRPGSMTGKLWSTDMPALKTPAVIQQ